MRRISVTVVVSGRPVTISRVWPVREVGTVAKWALKDSGFDRETVDEWEMRNVEGKLLEYAVTLGDYDIKSGQTLYLSPRAGTGA